MINIAKKYFPADNDSIRLRIVRSNNISQNNISLKPRRVIYNMPYLSNKQNAYNYIKCIIANEKEQTHEKKIFALRVFKLFSKESIQLVKDFHSDKKETYSCQPSVLVQGLISTRLLTNYIQACYYFKTAG